LRKSDVAAVPAKHQQTLSDLLSQSKAVRTLVEMRSELASMWGRSSASREQMLAHLQDWVSRAEASGIGALQEMALRIRRYQPVPVAA
ncbi:MAG TPA: transposase, partial [Burkholderiaceae bacterium]|nr:transposase [Burkholderiaceae bacterium]